jgi:hypothetical protein
VRELVEHPGKLRVTSEETSSLVLYHLFLSQTDRDNLQESNIFFRSLKHIAIRATRAHLNKRGALDNEYRVTE